MFHYSKFKCRFLFLIAVPLVLSVTTTVRQPFSQGNAEQLHAGADLAHAYQKSADEGDAGAQFALAEDV